MSNLIVLGNDVLLGHDSGAELVFVALAAVPFALFDLAEPAALIAGVAFALLGFGDRAFARGARLVRGAAQLSCPVITMCIRPAFRSWCSFTRCID